MLCTCPVKDLGMIWMFLSVCLVHRCMNASQVKGTALGRQRFAYKLSSIYYIYMSDRTVEQSELEAQKLRLVEIQQSEIRNLKPNKACQGYASISCNCSMTDRRHPAELPQAVYLKRGNIFFLSSKEAAYKELKGCLLYTSPSPRDRTRSRMPSSA